MMDGYVSEAASAAGLEQSLDRLGLEIPELANARRTRG
jgi:hypothetical protein